jgi:cell division protein FtsB
VAIRIALRLPKLRRRAPDLPRDASPDWEFPTDAHLSAGRPRRGEEEAEVKKRLRFRKRVTALVLVAIFVVGSAAALFAKGGYVELRRLRSQHAEVEAEVEAQRAEVAALEDEVRRLAEDPLTQERIAREQLGLARPGEVTFLLPGDDRHEGVSGDEEEDPGGTRPVR